MSGHDVDPAELLAVAHAAADAVVPRLASARAGSGVATATKSSGTDLVTDVDRWSEATIVQVVAEHRPDDGVVGEEGAAREGTTGVVWVIDPIDGTTNFVYDHPGFSVSIAATVDGDTVAGVVHDPVRDERFAAVRGGGATRDGAPVSVGDTAELRLALVATGFAYDADRRRSQAEVLTGVLPQVRDIRRMGGAAIDLCSVACGRVDAFYERGLGWWDHAAGVLVAREAGARVLEPGPGGGALVVSAPGVHDALCELLARHGAHRA